VCTAEQLYTANLQGRTSDLLARFDDYFMLFYPHGGVGRIPVETVVDIVAALHTTSMWPTNDADFILVLQLSVAIKLLPGNINGNSKFPPQ